MMLHQMDYTQILYIAQDDIVTLFYIPIKMSYGISKNQWSPENQLHLQKIHLLTNSYCQIKKSKDLCA